MIFVFILASLLLLASAGQPSCENIFQSFCIDHTEFHEWVAHGIHSLKLQELQYFFDADATEDNNIPTVNDDLTSPNLLHQTAVDLNLNNSFLTPAMQSVDYILSNWESENFIMKNSSVLELLVHNLHMYETLSVAGKMYQQIKRKVKNQKKNGKMKKIEKMKNLCECIKGKEDKIIKELEDTANRFRETNERKKAHWRNYYCWCNHQALYAFRSAKCPK